MKKINISRGRIEIIVVLFLVICGLSVFSVSKSSKTTLVYDNGKITYTGYVVTHRMNGQGQLTYQNGDVYKGHFVNGIFDGEGTYTAKSGWSYSGEFKDGQPNGQGTLKAQNGKVYTGTFKQGIFQK